jgi:small subunit ribosomal protein S16
MLRIRLRRTGKTKQPTYRVVIADSRAKRDGDFVEIVGHYNPRTRPSTLELKEERVRHWLAQGALPSETVHRLLYKQGLTTVEPPKRATKPSKAEVEAQRTANEAAAARAAEDAAAAAASAATTEEEAPAADADAAEEQAAEQS